LILTVGVGEELHVKQAAPVEFGYQLSIYTRTEENHGRNLIGLAGSRTFRIQSGF
jgi:hypothetical protein